MATQTLAKTPTGSREEIKTRLRRLERRSWWLFWASAAVMLVLSGGVIATVLPVLSEEMAAIFQLDLKLALRGLVGVVLIFNIYVLWQHFLIVRLRGILVKQVEKTTRLETQAEASQKLAILDPLTRVYNRRFLDHHLPGEVARSQRQGYPLTALMLDLNKFKEINDEYGHLAGDLVLKEFSDRLKKSIRSSDIPVRMGGDEFLVLFPDTNPEEVPRALMRLGSLKVAFGGEEIPFSFAAGWTSYQPGELPEQLLERADQTLLADKRTGKAEEAIRLAQTQVQQVQKMEAVGRLAAGVAHDFNNLLMLMKGYTELLLDQTGQDEAPRRYGEEIQKAVDRAAALTQQLLAFSRQQVLEPKILDLNAGVANMETMLRRLIPENIKLVLSSSASLGRVKADPNQLEQVIMNLAVNARDAMPRGGTLTIETANANLDATFARRYPGVRPGSYVMLAVSDSGEGMSNETMARLFEPFYTTKVKGRGTGLGLATVYGIVKQSGGCIAVDSLPGQGSTFKVYLPRTEAPLEVPETLSAAEQPTPGSETVLVVEDQEGVRKLARQFLEGSGYRVLEAENGAAAIQLAQQHEGPIHLLVTDVVMPGGMNGRELAEQLARLRPETKVLYVSGYTDHALGAGGVLEPGTAFLPKPFSRDTLARKVREVLETAQQYKPFAG